jgi:hypothetical protein
MKIILKIKDDLNHFKEEVGPMSAAWAFLF